MKNFGKIGNIIFDYIIITILLTLSLALVFPFIPILIGTVNYFQREKDERRLKDIFSTIKDNLGIIVKLTLFLIVAIGLSLLNIIYFNSKGMSNDVITIICYIVLVYCLIIFVNSPILVLQMRLTLKQLLFNCITLIFGRWYLSLLTFLLIGGVIVGGIYFIHIVPFTLYFIALIINKSTIINFKILKAKALKTTVEELNKPHEDTYYDELINKGE